VKVTARRTLLCFVDGGTVGGNPGSAVYFSYAIELPDGSTKVLARRIQNDHYCTSSESEYCGLLALLEWIRCASANREVSFKRVRIHSDSRLVVNYMNGHGRTRPSKLKELKDACWDKASELVLAGVKIDVVWIPRREIVKRLGH
jgi:ribonuclease HI